MTPRPRPITRGLGGRTWAARPGRRPAARRGTVLIVTMWIVLALAGLVLVLAQAVRVELLCSANELAGLQAEAVEQGAIQYVLAGVDSLDGESPTETDMPCEAVRVGEGAFWIIRPNWDNDREWSYGVVDEASKVNLNSATLSMLTLLPDMTAEFAAAIVDWRDNDSDVTPGGAENEYYLLLADPYQCKNAPFETVEELFLVSGATDEILFGEDTNRNGVLDDNENDADVSEPLDNRDGQLDRGLLPFVTVYSVDRNTTVDGDPRVDVNNAQGQELTDLFQKVMSADRAAVVLNRLRPERPFRNVLDFYFRSGLTMTEFESLADQVTTNPAGPIPGLINVNTAPRQVLACLPGLEESDVTALLAKRADGGDNMSTLAWVAGVLSAEKATAIGSFITTRGYQFSADIVSVSGDGRAFRRCRVVVDAQSSPPKVVYRQDLTQLGWPLDPAILARLRAGASLDEIAPVRTLGQEVTR